MDVEKIGGLDTDFGKQPDDERQTDRFDRIIAHNYGPLRRLAQIGNRLFGRKDRTSVAQDGLSGQMAKSDTDTIPKPLHINASKASEQKMPGQGNASDN